ncbi:MAG: cold-shock protein [Bacteroidales bacterium]|nr:cold-shock protein [Bacteroidales bacterium]
METGKVKWYDQIKGFGFIEPENGKDLFVHRTGLNCSADELQEGTEVEFDIKEGDKGLFAVDVVVVK